MSINVTVKGNPTLNKKMASGLSNDANNEIKKRRQMRLQQVRQQSKDIAQTIRTKVKKEQDKQISQASHDNTTKLKQWQNQKLSQLQNQYHEELSKVGSGHIQAADEEKFEEHVAIEKEKRMKDAKDRGFQAAQKLQIEKNEQNMRKALPAQQKKFVREVENTRASLVSKLKTPEKEQETRKSTDTGDSVPNVGLNLELSHNDTLNASTYEDHTESHSTEDSVLITTTIKAPRKQKSKNAPTSSVGKDLEMKTPAHTSKSSMQDIPTNQIQEPEKRDISQTDTRESSTRQYYFDTRISDRIKSRVLPFPDSEKVTCASDYVPSKVCCPCPPDRKVGKSGALDTVLQHIIDSRDNAMTKSNVSEKITMRPIKSQPKPKKSSKTIDRQTASSLSHTKSATDKAKRIDIPTIAPVALIPSNETLTHLHSLPPQPTNISRVHHYDHRNRYNTEYLTDNSNIQKIVDENLVQLADPDDILKDSELMRKRDREAQQRGQKALEKERIHREYNELLQKLPVLQKQERIACICRDKPTFHMNKERLEEVENKRQNVMENAYENLFTNVITLSPKLKVAPGPNMPFVTIHNPDNTSKRSREVHKLNEPQSGLDENQTYLLQVLLKNLQEQKGMLEQLGSIPEEQNILDAAASDSKKSSKNIIHKPECDCVQIKALVLQNISTQTSPAQTSRIRTNVVASSPKRPHKSVPDEVDESASPKRAKKIRSKIPADTKTSGSTKSTSVPVEKAIHKVNPSSDNTDSSMPVRITKPKHKCNCIPQVDCDQLCEIRIRIQENEKPEIIISSPKKRKGTQAENLPTKPILKDLSHSEPVLKASSRNHRKRPKTTSKSPKRVAVNNKPTTWGEHFAQNSSSSTTYYSPPLMQHATSKEPKGSRKTKSTTDSSAVYKKPVDKRLMSYISKLLELSKAQIDEINISSVSDVTTPSNSIMESASNRPMKQLMNIMKLFKLSPMDIATNLNYSKNSSPAVTINSNSTQETPGDYDASKSLQTDPTRSRLHYSDISDSSKNRSDSSKSTEKSTGFLTKYAEMADICHRRISDLTAKIEKIRQEKQEILESHSESDKENSTVYQNLPSDLGQVYHDGSISPHSMEEQKKLNEKLLRFNSPSESNPVATHVNYEEFFGGVVSDILNDVDSDILNRYLNLKTDFNKLIVDVPNVIELRSQLVSESKENVKSLTTQNVDQLQFRKQIMQNSDPTDDSPANREIGIEDVVLSVDNPDKDILDLLANSNSNVNKLTVDLVKAPDENVEGGGIETETRQDLFFVPLLDDIPRLPKLATSITFDNQSISISQGKKPPPSKGLIAARKFKGDIIAAPHELSTIAEADSLISAKINLKSTSDRSIDRARDTEKQVDLCYCESSSSSSTSSEGCMPDMLSGLIGKVNVTDDFKEDITKRSDPSSTSTEKSDLETIEKMLKSIGMDWAIPTLRKTRETLDCNSSSCSIEEPMDCQVNELKSSSQVESCSSSSCQSCYSSFNKDFDGSQISGGSSISDKCQRTSTPVDRSKNGNGSKNKGRIFTGESDLSSVPQNTDDPYLTMPDVSLKTHYRTE